MVVGWICSGCFWVEKGGCSLEMVCVDALKCCVVAVWFYEERAGLTSFLGSQIPVRVNRQRREKIEIGKIRQ